MGRSRVPTKLRTGAPREGVVLCPPARMGRPGVPFETWCEEKGERGARLLAEYADTEKSAREVTKASHHKALWNCRDCGHEWRARVDNRTKSGGKRNPTSGGKRNPTDCPACAGQVATETHNLKLTCETSGGLLAHLLGQWNHPTMRMEDFCPGSNEKVPWQCGKCGEEWEARISDRTRSHGPTGCPGCSNNWSKNRKLIEL
jgi:rubrerythrin